MLGEWGWRGALGEWRWWGALGEWRWWGALGEWRWWGALGEWRQCGAVVIGVEMMYCPVILEVVNVWNVMVTLSTGWR